MAYIQGQSRSQTSLFPVSLEELIPEDHLVRVIDLYVAKLDLARLGFDKALPKSTGRPSYDPADQLKLYLYGYFQRKWLIFKQISNKGRIYQAKVSDCASCTIKAKCTDAKRRYISRHLHEQAFERMEQRMQAHPEMMVSRRSIVEHPFGNLKQWLFGNARFLLRQLEGARAEMALAVNACNLKRAINVLGVRQMMALMG